MAPKKQLKNPSSDNNLPILSAKNLAKIPDATKEFSYTASEASFGSNAPSAAATHNSITSATSRDFEIYEDLFGVLKSEDKKLKAKIHQLDNSSQDFVYVDKVGNQISISAMDIVRSYITKSLREKITDLDEIIKDTKNDHLFSFFQADKLNPQEKREMAINMAKYEDNFFHGAYLNYIIDLETKELINNQLNIIAQELASKDSLHIKQELNSYVNSLSHDQAVSLGVKSVLLTKIKNSNEQFGKKNNQFFKVYNSILMQAKQEVASLLEENKLKTNSQSSLASAKKNDKSKADFDEKKFLELESDEIQNRLVIEEDSAKFFDSIHDDIKSSNRIFTKFIKQNSDLQNQEKLSRVKILNDQRDQLNEIIKEAPDKLAKERRENTDNLIKLISKKDLKSIKKLLSRSKNIDIDAKTKSGESLIFLAIQNNDMELVKLAVKFGVNLEVRDVIGNTPLTSAANNKYYNILEYLLNSGADPNIGDYNNLTIVNFAARNNLPEIIKLSKKFGANVNIPNANGTTPAYIAAQLGHNESLIALKDAQADFNIANKEGRTPVWIAAQNGRNESLKLLKEFGAEIDVVDNQGYSPVRMAAQNGHNSTIKLLKEFGARINNIGSPETTPIAAAIFFENTTIVKTLLEFGAKTVKLPFNGNGGLHLAAKKNDLELAKILISRGEDPDSKNHKGQSAIDIARSLLNKNDSEKFSTICHSARKSFLAAAKAEENKESPSKPIINKPNLQKLTNEEIENYRNRAQQHNLRREFDKAIACMDKIIQATEFAHHSDYFLRCEALSGADKEEMALEDINKAIELQPNNGEYYFCRGCIYGNIFSNNRDKRDKTNCNLAIKDFTKALNLGYNKDANLYYKRGARYQNIDQNKRALEDYKMAIKLGMDKELLSTLMADAFWEVGSEQEKIDSLKLAIQHNPDSDPLLYYRMGDILFLKGQYQESINYSTKTIELLDRYNYQNSANSEGMIRPKDFIGATLANIGHANFNLGKNKEALENFTKAIIVCATKKDNESMMYYTNNRAFVYYEMGLYKEALNDIDKFMFSTSYTKHMFPYRMACYSALGDYEKALKDANSFIGSFKAEQLISLGLRKELVFEVFYQRAIFNFNSKDYKKAAQDCIEAMTIDKDNKDLAYCLERCNKIITNKVVDNKPIIPKKMTIMSAEYNESLEQKIQNVDRINSAGVAFYREKNYKMAIKTLSKALDIYRHLGKPDKLASCLYNLGSSYLENGNLENAKESLNESYEIRIANFSQNHEDINKVKTKIMAIEKMLNANKTAEIPSKIDSKKIISENKLAQSNLDKTGENKAKTNLDYNENDQKIEDCQKPRQIKEFDNISSKQPEQINLSQEPKKITDNLTEHSDKPSSSVTQIQVEQVNLEQRRRCIIS